MFEAVDKGDAEAIRALIRKRADVVDAQRPSDGLSVLMYAMYQGKWELVDIIAPVHPGLDVFESAALNRAARVKHLTTTNPHLLEKRSPDGWSALHLAAFFGQIDAAKVLIERGAEVDIRSENELANTPLHAAAAGRHFMVCELLISDGADVNAKQHGGYTPLMAAAQHGDRGLCELLLRRGARKDLTNDAGQTAADLAQGAGHSELAGFLR
jgi:ankyrin repeat protein